MKKRIIIFVSMLLCLLSACGTKNVSGEEIVSCAKQYIGNPYEWKGTSLTEGCDSTGFVAGVLAEVGLIPDESADSHAYDAEELSEIGEEVSSDDIQAGDILIYGKMTAICIDETHIIYAKSIKDGIIVEELEDLSAAYGGLTAIRRVT